MPPGRGNEHDSQTGQHETQPRNIPLPPSRMDTPDHTCGYGSDVHALVGSPEAMSSFPPQSLSEYFAPHTPQTSQAPENGNLATPSGPSRPSYLRSVTSPAAAPISGQRHSAGGEGAAGLANSLLRSAGQRKRKRHEWTVFGELMGDDGGDLPARGASHFDTTPPRPTARESIREVLTLPLPSRPWTRSLPPSPIRPSTSSSSSSGPESNIHHAFDSNDTISEDAHSLASSTTEMPTVVSIDQPPSPKARRWFELPTLTPVQRNILKCSVAYFIGSLFTFSPYLSSFIVDVTDHGPGERMPSPSGHMVATVAVYFNPAKTVGGMLEADTFCAMGVVYATFVSLCSMSMYWFFETQSGWEWLADSLVILWIGVGMSIMAWMKMWMAKPTFNTACSMTSIILFTVVVKEGGVDTLLQVTIIILTGSLISNVVCYTLWPQRATSNLQRTMTQTLDSFSTLLTMITEIFLLEEPLLLVSQEKLDKATKDHQGSFTKLKKDLGEAQSERLVGGPGRPYATISAAALGLGEVSHRGHLGQAYEDAVDSINRLGQHLNGLRSGISVQKELVRASRAGKLTLRSRSKKSRRDQSAFGTPAGNGKGKLVDGDSLIIDPAVDDDNALLQAAADAFGDIIEDLGPPLKALSTACSITLRRLREAFNQPHAQKKDVQELKPEEFHDLADALERALFTFESTSNHAVLRLYRRGAAKSMPPGESPTIESLRSLAEENSVLTGADSESIFLVYFFFFTLQEFSKELMSLVDAMSRICNIQKQKAERVWWERLLRPWEYVRDRVRRRRIASEKRRGGISKRFSSYFLPEPAHESVSFPKITPHAPNTKQTPAREDLSFIDRVGQTIWAFGARLRENDLKYAFKTGMATAMLAAPAFFDMTRPVFNEYRGEWALISFFVVMSPTIGATNFLGVHRVLGTLSGAATAVIVWSAFPENPYVLSIFGFFFSIPCFYYIVARPEFATSARFVLLTYNLTCLYCYNLRQKDISVVDVAFHRASAVIVGVVWAAIVVRYWWPIEARRELGKKLGEFCLNIGWLYTRLVAFNSGEKAEPTLGQIEESEPTEATTLLTRTVNPHLNQSILEFMAMELHLQIKLIELQGLLAQTQHEPRLKGPFPVKLYRSMLTSLQTILDKLHSMRCVTSREEWNTTVKRDFIIPTNRARRDMVGNVILYFSTLAAAFRLKSPLPPYLPPAEDARRRLVDAIRQLDIVKNRDVRGSRQLLFFAYALTMRGVIQELDYLGRTLQETFGVIGDDTEAFEALFRDTAYEIA